MRKWLRRLFNRKPKSYLLDGKYEIVPAFEFKGEVYYMHKNPLNTLAGRGLTALVFMEELLMRCDINYLKDHVALTKQVFSDPKKIDISTLVKLNSNLEERINLLVAIPDQVYKMASVVFFTKNESPYRYDHQTGMEKVKEWRKSPDMYSFFLQPRMQDLIPSLALPENNSKEYLEVVEKINDLHLRFLRETLSGKTLTTAKQK